MPSPSSIPGSSSYPNIASSSAKSHSLIPPPSYSSVSSARSTAKFSYWPHWSNINQLGNFIIPGRKSSDSLSKHSDLTEESLEAHNRRHAPIIRNRIIASVINVDEKNAKCSPYYKGLTDASLVINRERCVSSPGRESHATTVATSTSSSLSSFIVKMQEWSSCFSFKSHTPITSIPLMKHTLATPTSTKTPVTTSIKGNVNPEKPLRERVSESESESATTLPSPSKDANIQIKDEEKDKFIWANKYQPRTLKEFICNRDKVVQLQDLVKQGGCGNFIFEGPPGVGKRTMICAMLREAFGPDTVQTREGRKVFDLKGELIGSIQVTIKESSQHVEVNLSDLKGYEKHVILELMKETQGKISNKSNSENSRAIILCEADKLSTDALLYIRWLLERYKGLNKVFFCCSDVSKLQPIKSLCTVVQLFPPSKQEIVEVLGFIAKREGIELPHKLAEKIAYNSKNNLRQAIRSFEASWQMHYPFKEDHQVILTGWEDDITNIAKKIIEEQSPKQLYIIRGKLQNLIEHDVSLDFIFESLVEELKRHSDVELHSCIDNLYYDYNRDEGGMFDDEKPYVSGRSRHGELGKRLNDPVRKNVQHFLRIEEFIAKFMSRYKITVTNNRSEQQDTAT